MSFAENLKAIRKQRNVTQEQLAEMLGVSRQAVSKWESGDSTQLKKPPTHPRLHYFRNNRILEVKPYEKADFL